MPLAIEKEHVHSKGIAMGGNNFKVKFERHGAGPDGNSSVLIIIGVCLLGFSLIHGGDIAGPLVGGAICFGVGAGKMINARRLPKVQIMRLAESRNGLLTLSEITTALDIDPDIAIRTLKALAKTGIAQQRWEEVRKNLWEFPDYLKLPAQEPLAKSSTPEPLNRSHADAFAETSPPSPGTVAGNPLLQHQ